MGLQDGPAYPTRAPAHSQFLGGANSTARAAGGGGGGGDDCRSVLLLGAGRTPPRAPPTEAAMVGRRRWGRGSLIRMRSQHVAESSRRLGMSIPPSSTGRVSLGIHWYNTRIVLLCLFADGLNSACDVFDEMP